MGRDIAGAPNDSLGQLMTDYAKAQNDLATTRLIAGALGQEVVQLYNMIRYCRSIVAMLTYTVGGKAYISNDVIDLFYGREIELEMENTSNDDGLLVTVTLKDETEA